MSLHGSTLLLSIALLVVLAFALGAALGSTGISATGFAILPGAHCINGSAQAIISPGSADALIGALGSAQETIDVQMYVFTAGELKKALADAVRRGVRVRVILEPRIDSNLATASELRASGVEVRWASMSFANTHSKLAIIDNRKVLVGSINWSKHALYENREAELLVEDWKIAREFAAVFEQDWLAASAGG